MASPNSETQYNLFIKPTKIHESVNGKDDKSTEYIILQNNTLVSQHLEDVKEITSLKNQVDELEEYNNNLERGKQCIQGIAKNQYLLNQEKSKMIEYYTSKLCESMYNTGFSHMYTLPLLLVCFLNVFAVKIAVCIIVFTIQAKSGYIHYKFYKNIGKEQHFIDSTENMKNLDKSSETLHDLIDNY